MQYILFICKLCLIFFLSEGVTIIYIVIAREKDNQEKVYGNFLLGKQKASPARKVKSVIPNPKTKL